MVEKMVQAAVVLDILYTFLKQFNNAMVIFSTNKKNTEKKKEKQLISRRTPSPENSLKIVNFLKLQNNIKL